MHFIRLLVGHSFHFPCTCSLQECLFFFTTPTAVCAKPQRESQQFSKSFLFLFSVYVLFLHLLVPCLLGNKSAIVDWCLRYRPSPGPYSVMRTTQCLTERPSLVGRDADKTACKGCWVAAYPVAWCVRTPPCSGGRTCVPNADVEASLYAVVACLLTESVALSDTAIGIRPTNHGGQTVFSTGRSVFAAHRECLLSEHVKQLIFLHDTLQWVHYLTALPDIIRGHYL